MGRRMSVMVVLVLTCGLLCAPVARAQSSGSIAGVVRDTSGGVLPSVTVETASSRAHRAGPQRRHRCRRSIPDHRVRPGTYTVTFSLPGFTSVKREGIELTSGFTATVNGELCVGALEETSGPVHREP
jgi:hypothetical protein